MLHGRWNAWLHGESTTQGRAEIAIGVGLARVAKFRKFSQNFATTRNGLWNTGIPWK